MLTEIRVTSAELRYPVIACTYCAAEVSIDLNNEAQVFKLTATAALPCTVCDTPIDHAIGTALKEFVRWYITLMKAGRTVSFRIQGPVPR